MSFLPIVERELRAASRRRVVFKLRWWTTLVATAVTACALIVISFFGLARGPGNPLFAGLTLYAFVLCLVTGVLLTADALARERREGTLGLLFLTDLKGYDIVLGKFCAHSISAFYALLALLPATALPLLLGGVEGAEFFRRALTLLNALFVSLAAGVLVSAFSRDAHNALGNSLGLVVVLAAVLPAVGIGFRWVGVSPAWQTLAWFSPSFAYAYSAQSVYLGQAKVFWTSLALAHFLGWFFLAIASLVLSRTFQDKPVSAQGRPAPRKGRERPRPRKGDPELLTRDPVRWLRRSELGVPWLAWGTVALWGAGAVVVSLFSGRGEFSMLFVESVRPFGFFLKLLFAVQACRFFVDARQTGTLELLLCTPLSNRQIIYGQMKALLRAYGPPLVVLIVFLFVPVLFRFGAGLYQTSTDLMQSALGAGVLAALFTVRLVADILAILWVGTALALTNRRPSLAPTWTVLFVLVLPSPLAVFCWADILLDLVFISWGTNKCSLDLRRLVADQFQAFSARAAPPVPRPRFP